MGAEEMKKRRKSHDKHIDLQRIALATPTLLTLTPEDQPRSCLATIQGSEAVEVGDRFIIEAAEGGMLGLRGNAVVLIFSDPPADILAAVCSGAGVAMGKVQRINGLSRTVEVSIR